MVLFVSIALLMAVVLRHVEAQCSLTRSTGSMEDALTSLKTFDTPACAGGLELRVMGSLVGWSDNTFAFMNPVTIQGLGINPRVTAGAGRTLQFGTTPSVTVQSLTIENGGLHVRGCGTAYIEDVVFKDVIATTSQVLTLDDLSNATVLNVEFRNVSRSQNYHSALLIANARNTTRVSNIYLDYRTEAQNPTKGAINLRNLLAGSTAFVNNVDCLIDRSTCVQLEPGSNHVKFVLAGSNRFRQQFGSASVQFFRTYGTTQYLDLHVRDLILSAGETSTSRPIFSFSTGQMMQFWFNSNLTLSNVTVDRPADMRVLEVAASRANSHVTMRDLHIFSNTDKTQHWPTLKLSYSGDSSHQTLTMKNVHVDLAQLTDRSVITNEMAAGVYIHSDGHPPNAQVRNITCLSIKTTFGAICLGVAVREYDNYATQSTIDVDGVNCRSGPNGGRMAFCAAIGYPGLRNPSRLLSMKSTRNITVRVANVDAHSVTIGGSVVYLHQAITRVDVQGVLAPKKAPLVYLNNFCSEVTLSGLRVSESDMGGFQQFDPIVPTALLYARPDCFGLPETRFTPQVHISDSEIVGYEPPAEATMFEQIYGTVSMRNVTFRNLMRAVKVLTTEPVSVTLGVACDDVDKCIDVEMHLRALLPERPVLAVEKCALRGFGREPLVLRAHNTDVVVTGLQVQQLGLPQDNDGVIFVEAENTTVLIDGVNADVSAGRFLSVKSLKSVTVSNSVIRNALSSNDGGAAYFLACDKVTLRNVTFDGNTARSGGALVALQSQVYMENVTAINNKAELRGGAFDIIAADRVECRGCHMRQNRALLGAALAATKSTSVLVEASEASENYAELGAVFAFTETQHVEVRDSVLEGNLARESGGTARVSDSAVVYNRTIAKDNTALIGAGVSLHGRSQFEAIDSAFEGNSVSSSGGAIYSISNVTVALKDTSFTRNEAAKDGGALVLSHSDSVLTVDGVTANANSALDRGGAFFVAANSRGSAWTRSSFSNNVAESGGDAFFLSDGDAAALPCASCQYNALARSVSLSVSEHVDTLGKQVLPVLVQVSDAFGNAIHDEAEVVVVTLSSLSPHFALLKSTSESSEYEETQFVATNVTGATSNGRVTLNVRVGLVQSGAPKGPDGNFELPLRVSATAQESSLSASASVPVASALCSASTTTLVTLDSGLKVCRGKDEVPVEAQIVVFGLFTLLALATFALGLYKKRRSQDSVDSLVLPQALFGWVDVLTDVAFVLTTAYEASNDDVIANLRTASMIIVPLTLFINTGITLGLLRRCAQHAPFAEWWTHKVTHTSIAVLLALPNPESLNVLRSGLMDSLRAPFPPDMYLQFRTAGLVGVVLEDMPQIVIQIIFLRRVFSPVAVLSLIVSMIAVAFALVRRCSLVAVHKLQQSPGQHGFTADSDDAPDQLPSEISMVAPTRSDAASAL